MGCGFETELLTGLLDGELNAAERSAVEAHLEGCPPCRRELEELRAASGMVRGLSAPKGPASILQAIRREIGEPAARSSWVQWALSAAAAVFLAVNIMYFVSLRERKRDKSTQLADGRSSRDAEAREKDALTKGRPGDGSRYAEEKNLRLLEKTQSDSIGLPRARKPKFLTIRTKEVGEARFRAEVALQKLGVPIQLGAPGFDRSHYAKDTCITVEVTQAQLAALRKEFGRKKDLLVMADRPQHYRFAPIARSGTGGEKAYKAPRSGYALVPKEREDDSRGRAPGLFAGKDPKGPAVRKDLPEKAESEKKDKSGRVPDKKEPGPKSSAAKIRLVIYFHEVR